MTKALILAAGQGTRLRPLTNDKPKCLVHLQGASLLERQIKTLEDAKIKDIHIAVGYKADQIRELGYSTSFNGRYDTTNMVETLFSALSFIEKGGDLIIGYGDIVYQLDNLNKLLDSKDEISLMIDTKWLDLWALRLENPLDDAETLKIDEFGYIKELGKKPTNYQEIEGQYTGLIKIRADKISDLIQFYKNIDRSCIYDGNDFDNMYMTTFLQLLINSGWNAKAVLVENGWLEIDSVEDLECYENLAKDGKLAEFYNSEK